MEDLEMRGGVKSREKHAYVRWWKVGLHCLEVEAAGRCAKST